MSRGTADRRGNLRRVPRLTLAALDLVRRAAPRHIWATVGLQVLVAALLGAQLLIGRVLITELLDLNRNGGTDVSGVLPAFVGLIGANFASGAATAVLSQQRRLLTELVARRTMDGVIDVASAVDLSSYEDPDFYDHLERARSAGMYRPIEIVDSVTTLVTAVLTSVGVAIALATMEPLLLPLVLVAGIPLLLSSLHNSRHAYAFEYGMTVHARERLHLMTLLTGREPAKELRVFGAVGFLRRRYDDLTEERLSKMREFLRGRVLVSLFGTLATATGTGIALGSLVWLLSTGRTGVATAITAALAMQVLGSRLASITASVSKIVEAGMFLDDYHRFLELGDTLVAVPIPADSREIPEAPFGGLEVEDVSFTYPLTGRRVLSNVSLEVKPGEVVALVGENGSGKTTLVKLIAQLYRDVDGGRIRWNGVDTRELDAKAVQRQLTVLFQDFVHYELTVADNITLGRAADLVDTARAEDAARQAGAHGFISRLPARYDTRLGRQFLGGYELSGGQWQRLALARAFYRGGGFLILDEPTAALDPRAESDLFAQMRRLAAGKSVLLISHRFSSVRMADRIYVLRDGRIVEAGTHEELLVQGGLYAELFTLQASVYLGGEAAHAR